nr:hypothetical protein BaRGS_024978 [Batillaria attramentaria]
MPGPLPGTSAIRVRITVVRNRNGPVFSAAAYNVTIDETVSSGQSIRRVTASDADGDRITYTMLNTVPASLYFSVDSGTGVIRIRNSLILDSTTTYTTPSGKLVYTIVGVSYPNPAFNIAPAENDFFIASPTSVSERTHLTVEVADSAIPPKTAQTKVQVNIVRNIHRPTFTEIRYGAAIADTWAVGRTLFTVTAVDDDDSTPFNIDTPNAYFDYMIDEHYNPLADTYFGVTIDGVVYVRNNLLLDNSNSYFFYIIVIDRSWNPLSSRAPVIINVTKSDIVRTVGFTNRIYFIASSFKVNLIENKHRFLLVLGGTKPRDIVPQKEAVRRYLQTAIGQIVLIESIQTRLVVNNGILDYDEDGTDVVFVVADTVTYQLYENSALEIVTSSSIRENVNTNVGNVVQIRKPYDLTAVTGLSQRLSDSSLMSELSQFAFQLSKPITKSHVWWTDEPWAAFVALGGIVIILALVGVIVILRSYNKYNNYWERYRIYHATMASADFTEPPSFLREYETQSLNMYVPPDETVQELGEINMAYASGAAGTGNGTSTSIQNPVYGKVLY